MRLVLHVNYLSFTEDLPSKWWNKEGILDEMIVILDQQFPSLIQFFGNSDKFYPIKDINEVKIEYQKIKRSNTAFTLSEFPNTEGNYISIRLADTIGLRIAIEDNLNSAVEKMIETTDAIFRAYVNSAIFGPNLVIYSPGHAYPKRRPVRNYQFLYETGIVNFIDPRFFEENTHLKMNGFEKLLSAPLPAGVSRTDDKGLICIKWAGKFINEDSVTKALVAREDWCYDNLSLESDDNFNEYGDMIYTYLGSLDELNDSEFFDFYDEELEEAYKIYSIKSDSEIDKETAEEIKRFLSNGKTKNGLLIERAFLVAQDRDQAIRLLIRARELGLDDVLYFETLDGDRILWSTDPSGDWRTK